MNSYAATLQYLYGLQRRGMKPGLRNVKSLLKSVGNPERTFPSIHVAGTNGKGSTASFLASIGMEAGYRTGLYTSPHLVRFTERIRINGREIPTHDLVRYVQLLRPGIEALHATFFEATTCIAFRYFADKGVELAIIETGMGGRLDATNVLCPLVSVITNVAREHVKYLGRTIPAIAREKAGIIKRGTPCVTGSTDPIVLRTLGRAAAKRGTRVYRAGRLVRVDIGRTDGRASRLHLTSKHFRVRNGVLGLPGVHQVANAQLAVAALDVLQGNSAAARQFSRITSRAVSGGLRRVRTNTGLRGRLETFTLRKQYILDVAHNPAATSTLISSIQRLWPRPLIVVFGVMKDKEYRPMLLNLNAVAKTIVPVAPRLKRALKSGVLYELLRRLRIPAVPGGTVGRGIRTAAALCGDKDSILITGSHYVVGEAMEYLANKKT